MSKSLFSSLVALLLLAGDGRAGMPSPLPTDVETRLRLQDSALLRLQAISFFVAGILLCAVAVRFLWNHLQRDFPRLPRLSFSRALAGVLLWGLLFVVVLTMISGARELMTPGAWRKQGFTYQLAARQEQPPEDPSAVRRRHLERLRTALWQYAATHEGCFPAVATRAAITRELWEVPDTGMRYHYTEGLSAASKGSAPVPLVYEPELDPAERFVLWTNGDITAQRSVEIRRLLKQEKRR